MNDDRIFANEVFDQEELERLADGELSGAAYRDLLTRMDDAFSRGNAEPWRRCALALLEAQALKRELGTIALEAPRRETAGVAPARSRGLRMTRMALACAASFAAAFILAAVIKGVWMQPTTASREIVNASYDSAPVDAPMEKASAPDPAPTVVRDGAHEQPPAWEAAGNLTLAVNADQGSGEQRIEVPLYYVADGEMPAAWASDSAAPPALLEALENAGLRVTRRRQLWPLTLDDGRKVIIPVEQLVVAPASADSFQ
jgi:hypothetical protein